MNNTRVSPGQNGYFSVNLPVNGSTNMFTVTTGLLSYLSEHKENGFFCGKEMFDPMFEVNNLKYNDIFNVLVSDTQFTHVLSVNKKITLIFKTNFTDGKRTIESVSVSESESESEISNTDMMVTFIANEQNEISTTTKFMVKERDPLNKQRHTKVENFTEKIYSVPRNDHYYVKLSSSILSKTTEENRFRSARRSASKSARKASRTVGKLPKPEKKGKKGGKSKKKKTHTRTKTHKRKTRI